MRILATFWTLSRPAMAPLLLALVLVGYGLGHWEAALHLTAAGDVVIVLVAWLLLHAGSLWMNAALDRDQGSVLFGRPVSVPATARTTGLLSSGLGVVLASLASPVAGLCAAGCAILSIFYSHPNTAWKGHPLGGPLVNLLGYGLLTPLAGRALVPVPWTSRTVAVLAVLALAMLGVYFLAQVFQEDEDRGRGYRTLVARRGGAETLATARLCIILAGLVFVLLVLIGWLPRLLILIVPALVWLDRGLVGVASAGSASRAVRRMVLCAILAILLALIDHGRCELQGLPLAGQCTALVPATGVATPRR